MVHIAIVTFVSTNVPLNPVGNRDKPIVQGSVISAGSVNDDISGLKLRE